MKRKKKPLPQIERFDIVGIKGCPYGRINTDKCVTCSYYYGHKQFGVKDLVFCGFKRDMEKQKISDELKKITLTINFDVYE